MSEENRLPRYARKSISTVSKLIGLIVPGPLIFHHHPSGTSVDIPILYNGMALDRIHFDLYFNRFSPKGLPVISRISEVDEANVLSKVRELLGELRVLDAVEFRVPEDCWVVPVAWREFIVAHIKVSRDGMEVVPDQGLTAEVSSRIV